MRVVLDSNVYFSGLSSAKGVPGTILKAAYDKKYALIISPNIINEFSTALKLKRGWDDEHITGAIHSILGISELIHLTEADIPDLVRDADDNHVVAAAIVGKADLIVSGDKDLYTYKSFAGIGVSRPIDFVRTLGLG